MKQLLKISKKDVPESGAPFQRTSDRYDLKLPKKPEEFRELTIALVNFSMEKPQLLDVLLNASSALIANSMTPYQMLEKFCTHVRENVRIKEEQSQTNE